MESNKRKKGLRRAAGPTVFIMLAVLALYALGATDTIRRGADKTHTAEGMVFTGKLGDGSFHGTGKILFENGDTYEGSLSGGRFNGYGVYVSSEGWRYEGYFRNGRPVDEEATKGEG